MHYLSTLTPEQLKEHSFKSRLVKANNKSEGQRIYRQEWKDDEYWRQLAKKYNIRLPSSHIAPSANKLLKLARKLNVVNDEVNERQWMEGFFGVGHTSVKKALQAEYDRHPQGMKYGMRAYIGRMLEQAQAMTLRNG